MMKYANPSEMSKWYPKYEQYSRKRREVELRIISDGKHTVWNNGFSLYIKDADGNIVWDENQNKNCYNDKL